MTRIHRRAGRLEASSTLPPFALRAAPICGIHAAIAQVTDEAADAYAKAIMHRVLIEQQIAVLGIEDGADAIDHLSKIGWLLTWATETAVNVPGLHPSKRTIVHTALHLINSMCMLGYTWRATSAKTIDYALELGHQILQDHAPTAKLVTHDNADHYAAMIQQRKVQADSVAPLGEYLKVEVAAA